MPTDRLLWSVVVTELCDQFCEYPALPAPGIPKPIVQLPLPFVIWVVGPWSNSVPAGVVETLILLCVVYQPQGAKKRLAQLLAATLKFGSVVGSVSTM